MIDSEITSLRKAQAKRVMPLIGNLIDQWEMLPNDVRSDLEEQCPGFCAAIERIHSGMEGAPDTSQKCGGE